MSVMKTNPILRFVASPAIGKGIWQEQVAFLIYSASLVMICYLAYLLVSSPFYFGRLGMMQLRQDLNEIRNLPQLQSLEIYRNILDEHPIFGVSKQETGVVGKNPCDDFVQNFSLSGIVQGGENEAIFLNKRTRQTNFVTAGENLENITVQAIKEHSVVVVCAGKEKEILIEET